MKLTESVMMVFMEYIYWIYVTFKMLFILHVLPSMRCCHVIEVKY